MFKGIIGGTILWITYPSLFAIFPNVHGMLAETLGWWDGVCISFFANAIFNKNITISENIINDLVKNVIKKQQIKNKICQLTK